MKLFIEESTLTDIGNAIRDKGGTTELIPVPDLAMTIRNLPTGGGGGDVEPIVLTNDQPYACAGAIASAYIDLYGNKISTQNLKNVQFLFLNNTCEHIPFDINCDNGSYRDMSNIFEGAKFYELPRIYNAYPATVTSFCKNAKYLRNIPENYFDTWNFNRIQTYTYASISQLFYCCESLRRPEAPVKLMNEVLKGIQTSAYGIGYNAAFGYCYCLDEILDLGVYTSNTITTNMFSNIVNYCSRLKNFTFKTNEDGSPITANWSNQALQFGYYVGWCNMRDLPQQNNSGITFDKLVIDDSTYQALKNDPDWYSDLIGYSRYNHDSAVRTINSLPDCSTGQNNVVKFIGEAGALTDGGAINTLTEAEIAVAAAKGWTVTIS